MKRIVLDLPPMERNMIGYLLRMELMKNRDLPDEKTWQLINDIWKKAVKKARTIKHHEP